MQPYSRRLVGFTIMMSFLWGFSTSAVDRLAQGCGGLGRADLA